MISLKEVERHLHQGTITQLIQDVATKNQVGQLLAQALNMEQDILTLYPEIAFPILYDRLVWEDGSMGEGLLAKGQKAFPPNTELKKMLESWEREHNRPWLKSLWPPAMPLLPCSFFALPHTEDIAPSKRAYMDWSCDGRYIITGHRYPHCIIIWDGKRKYRMAVHELRRSIELMQCHDTLSNVFWVKEYNKEPQAFVFSKEEGIEAYEGELEFIQKEYSEKVMGCESVVSNGYGKVALQLKGDTRVWITSQEELKKWSHAYEQWSTHWHRTVRSSAYNPKATISEDGRKIFWRTLKNFVIWSVEQDEIKPKLVRSDFHNGFPKGEISFSKDGQFLVGSGCKAQFDDHDTAFVFDTKTADMVFQRGHRLNNWKDMHEIPPLVEDIPSSWRVENKRNRIFIFDQTTANVWMCFRGCKIEVSTRGNDIVTVGCSPRKALFVLVG